MLAEIFFLRLEASLRASEVAVRAHNLLLVRLPALPVPTSEKGKTSPAAPPPAMTAQQRQDHLAVPLALPHSSEQKPSPRP